MKQTVNLSDFRDAFRQCNRQDQFSYEALELIFDYYEEMESGMDEDELEQAVTDYLSEQTSVIGKTDSTIIFAQF